MWDVDEYEDSPLGTHRTVSARGLKTTVRRVLVRCFKNDDCRRESPFLQTLSDRFVALADTSDSTNNALTTNALDIDRGTAELQKLWTQHTSLYEV